MLVAPGTAGMINDFNRLNTLTQYMLQNGSPMVDAALDLPDPWAGYTAAKFDFFGNPVPKGPAADIGANESA